MLASVLLAALSAAPHAFAPKNRPYDAQHYALELRLLDDGAFHNRLTATLKATRTMGEIELDAYDLTVESAQVDGEAATFAARYDVATRTGTLTLRPKRPIPAGKLAQVTITYRGQAGVASGAGLFSTTEDEPGAMPGYFTQFAPTSAQRLFPCNDTPADKATSEVRAVVDQKYQVVSNGLKDLDEKFSEGGRNLRRVHWRQPQPHATYLIAVAISAFDEVPAGESPPSTLWVPPGARDRAFVAADALKGLVAFESAFTGVRYPWAKADVVAVPHLYFGGMENTSAIFERSSALVLENTNDQLARGPIVGLLAHELAHQWFGNLVTAAWWDDIWLSEGFATYLGQLAFDDANGPDSDEEEIANAQALLQRYFRQETGPRAHALVSTVTNPRDIYDSVTYTKGAQVLRMLEAWLGKAELQKALKLYLERHAFGTATSDDFFKAVFDSSKKERELRPFKDAWLHKRGYPVLFTSSTFVDGKLTVTLRQQNSSPAEKGPFVFKLPIVIHRATEPAYTQEQNILVDKPEVKVTFAVPAAPQWINWNKNFGALAQINGPSLSEQQLTDAARQDPDPVWRLIATLNLLGELAAAQPKEDSLPSDAALLAITDVLQRDPSPYVREAILERLGQTRLKAIPKGFATTLFDLARKPEGLNEDPVGYIRVRRAALEALGRVESADGQRYLLEEVAKRDIDINYLGAFAVGVARLGTPASLATLRAAVVTQRARGVPFLRRTAEALGAAPSIDVVPAIREVVKQHPANNELIRPIFRRLADNRVVLDSDDFAVMVKDLVIDDRLGEELRATILGTLDDVKTEGARAALTELSQKATSDRIKASAALVLSANFATKKK